MTEPIAPTLEPIMRLTLATGVSTALGDTASGSEELVAIDGGTVEGPGIAGTVPAGGSDLRITRADSSVAYRFDFLVHLGDSSIRLQGNGFRFGSADVVAALADGREVDPAQFYYRGTLTVSAAARELAYLGRALVVTSGAQSPGTLTLDAFLVT